MRTMIYGLTIVLVLCVRVRAADSKEQLARDIESIAAIVTPDEKAYVTNYLYKGPTLRSEYLTAAMACNAINKVTSDPRITLALARTMNWHATNTNFPVETRQYGFARLVDLAKLDKEVDVMARSSAAEIVKRDQGPLKRAAQRFLGEGAQNSPPTSNSFDASQLTGRWRYVDSVHKLTTVITFRQDGTYTGSVEANGKTNGSFSGKWTLKDGSLDYEYTASSDEHIPVGTKDRDRIIELTKDRYTIENTLGLRETYVRVE